jgi:hypothetical protein
VGDRRLRRTTALAGLVAALTFALAWGVGRPVAGPAAAPRLPAPTGPQRAYDWRVQVSRHETGRIPRGAVLRALR